MNRTLIWQLAIRYLRGKRSANAVPILSRVSMIAIAVGTAAMVIIFSVFNGMESMVKSTYKAFYPPIRITVARGKFFEADTVKLNAVKRLRGVTAVSTVIEDNAIAADEDNKKQKIITLKGVDNNYFSVTEIKQYMAHGADSVSTGHPYTAITGGHIVNELGVAVDYIYSKLNLYYLDPTVANPEANPTAALQELTVHPAGIFKVDDDFDSKYVLAPLPLVQQLFHQQNKYSSIEINAEPWASEGLKKQLQQLFGSAYRVENRYQQNRTLYAVMNTEKWAVRAILSLVLLIASFNMIGALAMLVIEKRPDIAILKAMGAERKEIRAIFLLEGVLWSLTGGLSGVLIGVMICIAQQQFGLVPMRGPFLADKFPVEIQTVDLLLVVGIIIVVGLTVSWYPATRATKAIDPSLKSA